MVSLVVVVAGFAVGLPVGVVCGGGFQPGRDVAFGAGSALASADASGGGAGAVSVAVGAVVTADGAVGGVIGSTADTLAVSPAFGAPAFAAGPELRNSRIAPTAPVSDAIMAATTIAAMVRPDGPVRVTALSATLPCATLGYVPEAICAPLFAMPGAVLPPAPGPVLDPNPGPVLAPKPGAELDPSAGLRDATGSEVLVQADHDVPLTARSSVSAISLADWNRFAGSRCSARWNHWSTVCGIAGFTWLGGVKTPVCTAIDSAPSVSPLKGVRPSIA